MVENICKVCGIKFLRWNKKDKPSKYCSVECSNKGRLLTHCKRGHELTEDNLKWAKHGRQCKKCCHIHERDRKLRCNYGIDIIEWKKQFELQGRKCAACGSIESNKDNEWHTDHNHLTEELRGILCSNCNTALGFVKD